MTDKPQDEMAKICEAIGRAAQAICDGVQAVSEYCRAFINHVGRTSYRWWQGVLYDCAAIDFAPPQVRHLIRYGKKRRTRKKNLNRARKLYRRMTEK